MIPRTVGGGKGWGRWRTLLVLAILGAATVALVPVDDDDDDASVDVAFAPYEPGADPAIDETVIAGQPVHVGLPPGEVDVELQRSAVRLADDSAPAATAATVCRGIRQAVIETTAEPLTGYCDEVLPVAGVALAGGASADAYIVVTIVPLAPGTLRVEGVVLEYLDGDDDTIVAETGGDWEFTVLP